MAKHKILSLKEMKTRAQNSADTLGKPYYLYCPKGAGFAGYKIAPEEPKPEKVFPSTIVLKFEPTI